eukprot:6148013-Prymnesium_polylepis.1
MDAIGTAFEDASIVDNRKAFYRVDDADREQPFYRVQLQDGRGHYSAQSMLAAVPRSESFAPIKGTSFFFTAADRESGCLVPRAELARRYPEDVALLRAGGVHGGLPGGPGHVLRKSLQKNPKAYLLRRQPSMKH